MSEAPLLTLQLLHLTLSISVCPSINIQCASSSVFRSIYRVVIIWHFNNARTYTRSFQGDEARQTHFSHSICRSSANTSNTIHGVTSGNKELFLGY